MSKLYDTYYETENLFGDPYPELIDFFEEYSSRGKVLDLGCGQGRNALALAHLGYKVVGLDSSQVGINQMNELAQANKLPAHGILGDIHAFNDYESYDIVLLDSMFHFAKKDKMKEIGLIQKISSKIKKGCALVFCIQDSKDKVGTLINALEQKELIINKKFSYTFEDKESGHKSLTDYRMIVVQK